MHLTILAHGSRGDVQPYIALGIGLLRAGYQVRLAAPQCFQEFVSAHGLDFAPLAGEPTQLARALADRAGRNPLRTGQVIAEYAEALCAAQGERMAACRAGGYQLDFVHRDAMGGAPLSENETRLFWESWFEGFPEMDFQVTRTIASSEVVVAQWIFTGVNDGPLGPPITETPIQATGKPIRVRGISIYEIAGGKIQGETMYIDFATFWVELGVTP